MPPMSLRAIPLFSNYSFELPIQEMLYELSEGFRFLVDSRLGSKRLRSLVGFCRGALSPAVRAENRVLGSQSTAGALDKTIYVVFREEFDGDAPEA